MLKPIKFFTYLCLYLGLYLSGLAIDFNHVFNENTSLKLIELVKEKKSSETQIPSPFIDLVDEREIDEDEQFKLNSNLLAQTYCLLLKTQLKSYKFKNEYLPYELSQNFSFKEPRVLLFHSWKLYHS